MGMMGCRGDVQEADEEGREMGRVVGACWWSKPGMVAKAARGAVRAGGRSQWRPEPVVAGAWWPEPGGRSLVAGAWRWRRHAVDAREDRLARQA